MILDALARRYGQRPSALLAGDSRALSWDYQAALAGAAAEAEAADKARRKAGR